MKTTLFLIFILSASTLCGCLGSDSAEEEEPEPEHTLTIRSLASYDTGLFDNSGTEIVAFQPSSQVLFSTNGGNDTIELIDLTDPMSPTRITEVDTSPYGQFATSIIASHGIVAFTVVNGTEPGRVVFLDSSGTVLNDITVGPFPDMLAVTPDGRTLLVANEGVPSDDYSIDPEGSVTIIDLTSGAGTITDDDVSSAGFGAFLPGDIPAGVRIYGPNATIAQDLEPEYIAISSDSSTAWVVLQENNAFATLDLSSGTFTGLTSFGLKDHSQPGQGLDPSDRDSGAEIAPWPVWGLYQPDGIEAFESEGASYLITANEGDGRDYDTYVEDDRVKDLLLDPTAFPNATDLQLDENLGRLSVSLVSGDTDGDGDIDELHSFGARSISIWETSGTLVWDSGQELEEITATAYPDHFNANRDDNDADKRSDNKGPEPSNVVLGVVGERTFAFVVLERIGGLMVYDVTDPTDPRFVAYENQRDFGQTPGPGSGGSLGPEGIVFVSAQDSPLDQPLLIVGFEVSGSIDIYALDLVEVV